MTRREITTQAAMLLLGGATITMLGCGSGGGDTTPAPTPMGDRKGTIPDNHTPGHAVTITSAQLAAGNALVLNIQANADHNHAITLTADEVVQIKNGVKTEKLTSRGGSGHLHTVQFN
jgi:hypothetical protein